MKAPTLKVIAGQFKGKTIQMASLQTTRSTKAIVKESLFNTLQSTISSVCFVEFFAGSGSVGIEALSRGAKHAVFFEKDKKAFGVLQFNLNTICHAQSYTLIHGDSFELYKQALGLQGQAIGYFDPPFGEHFYTQCFAMASTLPPCFEMIIFEHATNLSIPSTLGKFSWHNTRAFGKSALSYFSQS